MTTTMLDALSNEAAAITEVAKEGIGKLQEVLVRSAALSRQIDTLIVGGERLVGGEAEIISAFATVDEFAAFQARHFPYQAIQSKARPQQEPEHAASAAPEVLQLEGTQKNVAIDLWAKTTLTPYEIGEKVGSNATTVQGFIDGARLYGDPRYDQGRALRAKESTMLCQVDVPMRQVEREGRILQLSFRETAILELLNRNDLPVTIDRLARYCRAVSEDELRSDVVALNAMIEPLGLAITYPDPRLLKLGELPAIAPPGPAPEAYTAPEAEPDVSPKDRALDIYAVENLTQKELAERIGCGLTTLQAWLTGARRASDNRVAKGDLLRAEAKEAAAPMPAKAREITLPQAKTAPEEKPGADIAAAAGPLLKDGEVLSIDQNTCIVTRDTASIQLARHEMRMLRALNSGAPITLEDMMQALSVVTGRRVDSEVAKINPRIAQIGVLIVKNGAGEFQLSTDR